MHWSGNEDIHSRNFAGFERSKKFLVYFCTGLQFTGTLELAALGPTMLIFNLFTYIFTAITITTVRCYSFGAAQHCCSIHAVLHLNAIMFDCSLVADKLRTQDVKGAGDALSSALFVATTFGLMIQAVLLVTYLSETANPLENGCCAHGVGTKVHLNVWSLSCSATQIRW